AEASRRRHHRRTKIPTPTSRVPELQRCLRHHQQAWPRGSRRLTISYNSSRVIWRRLCKCKGGQSAQFDKAREFDMPRKPVIQDRRELLKTAAMGVAAAGAASLFTPHLIAAASGDAIRPFRIDIPKEALTDLRRRVKATKWPERETVADATQGVQLATIEKL